MADQTVRSRMIAQFPELLFHPGEAYCIASVPLHRGLDDFMAVSKASNQVFDVMLKQADCISGQSQVIRHGKAMPPATVDGD
mmetsp:Transcript_13152/g.22805  ORF Transcript_13152/g.22805 Transcript_13152/m.22805 type:complete len:82 (+) Transcript_13152:64-309(+)